MFSQALIIYSLCGIVPVSKLGKDRRLDYCNLEFSVRAQLGPSLALNNLFSEGML